MGNKTGAEMGGGIGAATGPGVLQNAVILIIRHAEKPIGGKGLSPEGEARAKAYVTYFQDFTVDSQPLKLDYLVATADSDQSDRPRLTLEPLGEALGLKVHSHFKDKEYDKLADKLLTEPTGKRILICWHHEEIPHLVGALGADPGKLLPGGGAAVWDRWGDSWGKANG